MIGAAAIVIAPAVVNVLIDDDDGGHIKCGLEMQKCRCHEVCFTADYKSRLSFPSEGEEGRQIIHAERRYGILEFQERKPRRQRSKGC